MMSDIRKFASSLVSRRTFLQAAVATAITTKAGAVGFAPQRRFAYVGTYTGSSGNGQGIYLYEMNPSTGELTLVKLAAAITDPSFILISPSGKYLYANSEVSNFQGTNGSVNAFSVDPQTGDLTLINTVSSAGGGPVYLSFDATGKFIFVANYGGGSISVLPVQQDGALGNVIDTHTDTGNLGPTTATDAPPGSFAFSGHDAPHAHCIIPSPDNKFVLYTDLGQDRIYVYSFDQSTGVLTAAATPFVSVPPGDGARHLCFHPNGRWLYSIQEEAPTVMVFRFDESSGELESVQTVSALPPGFKGSSFAAEVRVSSDGRFLYASNRLEDSICVFAIGTEGELTFLSTTAMRGDYTREFTIDPTGRFLYSCNQRSDNVTGYRINPSNGGLEFIDQFIAVGTPACLAFLP
jgi:6-phosphogluconolactonase